MDKINELRTQFDNMSTDQKKQFIDDLEKQLEGSNSTEHKNFLDECIQKYNEEAHIISEPMDVSTALRYSAQRSSLAFAVLIILGLGLILWLEFVR